MLLLTNNGAGKALCMRISTRVKSQRSASCLRNTIVLFVLLLVAASAAVAGGPWWNSAWHYRVGITAGAAGYARYNKMAESPVNFTQLLTALGKSGTLDANSLRVIETNAAGNIIDTAVSFQFDRDTDFNATTKASGTMVIFMNGTTGASASRYYDVYFDLTGGSFSAPSVPQWVAIQESDWDMGQAAYRIDGPGVSLYYQTEAGAFSSMIDKDYNDWIDWNFVDGPGGTYRGIPNAIFPESYFHPGASNAVSSVLSKGPLKVTVKTATSDGKWEARWEFYPRYATMTMVKADHGYWILYEGVPGGSLDGNVDFMYRSNGAKTHLYEQWEQDIAGDEWLYFSDPGLQRSLFMAHHEPDTVKDSYFNYSDSMTVFGFGRSNDPLEAQLTAVGQHFTFGLLNDTSYTLCRDSINSAYRDLTVTLGSPEQPGPDVPVLVSPVDAATNVSIPALLRWRTAARATGYRVQVATSSLFASGIILDDSTVTDTTRSASSLAGKTTYYWRVSARNTSGTSAFSTARSFTTSLAVPVLLVPANGATGRQQPVQLRWTSVNGATGYHVQVSTEAGFASGLVVNDAALVDTQRTVSGLQGATLYYWRVAGRDAGGDGSFAAAQTFTTAVPSPVLISPPDNAANQPSSITLVWSKMPAATYYHVQVATDPAFSSGIVLDDASITDTTRGLSGLAQSTRFYWRVSAGEAGGEGPFSIASSFTTVFSYPVLLFPGAGATGQPVTVTFRWNHVPGAVRYHFQLATDAAFSVLIKNDSTITDSTRQVVGLINATWYYWRVKATNGSASGEFSPSRSFRTIGQLPGIVTLVSPAMDASLMPDSVLCRWNSAPPATRYWLELSADSLFVLHSVDSTVTDTAKMVHSVLPDRPYWWRVRGGTAEGWGPFSSTWRFVMKPTGVVDREDIVPGAYALDQNFPNPFNPSTVIPFALPSSGVVRLEVFSLLGESVALLVDEHMAAGYHEVRFNTERLASGTYIYRLSVNGLVMARSMVLLR